MSTDKTIADRTAAAAARQAIKDAEALETYEQFKSANPHARALILNRDHAIVYRGKALAEAMDATKSKSQQDEAIRALVADATKPPTNNTPTPAAPAPAA